MLMRSTLFVLFLLGCVALRGEVLDRTVATVNGHVILLSDWDDELRYECLMSGRKLDRVTANEQKAALDRLIDQELLREQMRVADTKPVGNEQIQKQLDTLKGDVLRQNTGESWQQLLSNYRLSENFIKSHIAGELQQLQSIDTRFRPTIQISQAETEQYYKDQLVPQLPAGDPVSLTEATPRIREILVQRKMDEMLNSWLESLRAQAQIKTFGKNSVASSTPLQVGPQ